MPALHALAYCPRLFYLKEVEALYTQDAAVLPDSDYTLSWRKLLLRPFT